MTEKSSRRRRPRERPAEKEATLSRIRAKRQTTVPVSEDAEGKLLRWKPLDDTGQRFLVDVVVAEPERPRVQEPTTTDRRELLALAEEARAEQRKRGVRRSRRRFTKDELHE